MVIHSKSLKLQAILLFSRFSSLVKLQPFSQTAEWPFSYSADEPDSQSSVVAMICKTANPALWLIGYLADSAE
jgi:hypothetical protein